MADSDVPVTAGSGTLIDAETVTTGAGGVIRQRVNLGRAGTVNAPVTKTLSTSNQQLLAANTARLSLMLTNDQGGSGSGAYAYLYFGSTTPTASSYHLRLLPDLVYILDGGSCPLTAIQLVGSSAAGTVLVTEMQS